MDRETWIARAEALAGQTPGNECEGVRMFETPIFTFGSAEDALFEDLRKPGIIGEHFLPPKEWMPEAKTVVSLFFPFTAQVREANAKDYTWPAREWTIARVEGQQWITSYLKALEEDTRAQGVHVLVPLLDPRFWSKNSAYTSNWSERHVGYVCGMGTFGLSKGLISRRGTAGRYGSIIVDATWEVTPRDYDTYDAYCTRCGACIRHCPGKAITLAEGKDHPKCEAFVSTTVENAPLRFGCGKCQVKTPCETGIPRR